MTVRGRTGSDGSVVFYEDSTGDTVMTVDNDGTPGLLAGTASAVADSTATDAAGLVTDFNALLAVLRTRGVLASS